MRRTLAGLLFGLAYLCAGIALSGWMLQRSAFSPSRSEELAAVVLEDDDLREDLAQRIAKAAAAQLADRYPTLPQLEAFISSNLQKQDGAELMRAVVGDAHARLIGERNAPVEITGRQIADVVRDDRAAILPAIELPVPKVGVLAAARSILGWLVPVSAIGAVALAIVAFSMHPDRAALVRSLALGLVTFAVLITLVGYVVPRYVVPALSDNVWANVPGRLAQDGLPIIIGLDIILCGLALGLLVGASVLGKRRRWTAPVRGYGGYNEQRRWS